MAPDDSSLAATGI